MATDEGTRRTDARMRALDKRLRGIYDEAYQTAVAREKAAIAKLAALDVNKLRAQGLDDNAIRAKQLAHNAMVERETNIIKNIAAEISKSGETAAKIIQGEMLNVYGLNLDWSRYDVDREAGVMLDWTMYDKNQLKVLLDSEQSPFTKIAYNNLGKDSVVTSRLQNALTQAAMLGESQQQIMRRIRDVTGQSVSQARRVAQTERNRVQSQARFKGMEEASDMGIEMEKQWISRMDARVRDDHASVTGEVVDHDDAFSNGLMFPGDPDGRAEQVVNCRCVLKPRVKNVPESVKRYREEMDAKYGFDEWRENRLANQNGNDIIKPKTTNSTVRSPQSNYVPVSSLEEADAWLKSMGINGQYAKGRINIDVANAVNETVADYLDVFGNNMRLRGIQKYPKRDANFVAAYSPAFGDVFLYKAQSKDTMARMLKDAMEEFQVGAWSTGDAKHFIRHELGHALHSGIGRKETQAALQPLFDAATSDLRWGKYGFKLDDYKKSGLTAQDFMDDVRAAGETLSAYGFSKMEEMVAESVAEYMGGKPREFAVRVVNTLMGW